MLDLELPPPYSILGIPRTSPFAVRFGRYRRGQEAAVLSVVDSAFRFDGLNQPVGFGKSLTYALACRLLGGRSLILTSTKQLADQLNKDFAAAGLVDIRGKRNYDCRLGDPPGSLTVEDGPCFVGLPCEYKLQGCQFFDALRRAQSPKSTLIISNYDWWLSNSRYGEALGEIDTLICDEAHDAPDKLSTFLQFTFTEEHRRFLLGQAPPKKGWRTWAKDQLVYVRREYERLRAGAYGHTPAARRRHRIAVQLQGSLSILSEADTKSWVAEVGSRGRIRFTPIWPGPFAERFLFRRIPKVVLVSATIRPKTLQLLGLGPDDFSFKEYRSSFPVHRRPVIYIPTARVQYNMHPMHQRVWLERIDQIIARRLDRKGLIHCVSYERLRLIKQFSRFSRYMIDHQPGSQSLEAALTRFRRMKAPAIFLSPAAHTGVDLPYDECRYIIQPKLPFPQVNDPVLRARQRRDRQYPSYLAMLDIVQGSGRGMRAEDDACETFIIDDHWTWFKRRFSRFAPKWFLEACRTRRSVPDPPPLFGN